MKKPIVLVIMDGVGRGDGGPGDAVKQANTPTLDKLMATCPMTWLKAHGTAVGLPTDDDMGNSEVGHNALGCGQIYSQGAKLVQESIETGSLYQSKTWVDLTDNCLQNGKALVDLGNENGKVVVLDADLAGATMTKYFRDAYPQRFFDCGIAEADMMNIAAGLSTMGLVPFCSTFAMFGAGRAYEQIRNSIAYPRFNVKICCSHAGVSVGEDGGSHQAIEDIGLMRLIPGMTVIVPADAKEARKATLALAEFRGPAYMRLARLATPVFEEDYPFQIGKANVLREGTDAAVFACGLMVSETLAAARLLEAQGIHIAVINVHTIKPIDAACVTQWAEKCGNVVTVEEHSVIGGLGDAVADVLMGKVSCKFRKIGVNDQFGQSGKAADVLREYGLTADQIAVKIKEAL